ncbi:MAG: (Fe-S)-binding protein [Bacilli bacterium]
MLIATVIMLGIGALLGLLLAIAAKYLAVKEDERIDAVNQLLPGVNCGGCGYPGCPGFAKALVEGEVKKISTCKVLKPEVSAQIKEYLDTTPGPDGELAKVDI